MNDDVNPWVGPAVVTAAGLALIVAGALVDGGFLVAVGALMALAGVVWALATTVATRR